jgi:hypothetical protein
VKGPNIHELMAAAEGARLLTREQLLGLGAVARHPEAWAGLLEVHARHEADPPGDRWDLTGKESG